MPQKRLLDHHFIRNLRNIALRTVSAISILKSEGIVHADIKPENIFIYGQLLSGRDGEDGQIGVMSLGDLPNDFVVKIGDFGNSFVKSEASKFYEDFDMQSMPYRSPEVLMGVPFGDKIDVWSLGIVLLELCIGSTLFIAKTRVELFSAICDVFRTSETPLLFAGGRYTSDLLSSRDNEQKTSSKIGPKLLFSDHVLDIYRILSSRGVDVQHIPGSLVHFLAALTHVDPDQRLSAAEALQHDFLTVDARLPVSCLGPRLKRHNYNPHLSLSALRKRNSSKCNLETSAALCRRAFSVCLSNTLHGHFR